MQKEGLSSLDTNTMTIAPSLLASQEPCKICGITPFAVEGPGIQRSTRAFPVTQLVWGKMRLCDSRPPLSSKPNAA